MISDSIRKMSYVIISKWNLGKNEWTPIAVQLVTAQQSKNLKYLVIILTMS